METVTKNVTGGYGRQDHLSNMVRLDTKKDIDALEKRLFAKGK